MDDNIPLRVRPPRLLHEPWGFKDAKVLMVDNDPEASRAMRDHLLLAEEEGEAGIVPAYLSPY